MEKNWKEKVKELMEKRGINQKELSKLSGITESSISRYLSGERVPRIDIIVNLSRALEVDPDYLLDDSRQNDDSYESLAFAIARNGNKLTQEEKDKLIKALLGKEVNV